jgi:hypothetical protein
LKETGNEYPYIPAIDAERIPTSDINSQKKVVRHLPNNNKEIIGISINQDKTGEISPPEKKVQLVMATKNAFPIYKLEAVL